MSVYQTFSNSMMTSPGNHSNHHIKESLVEYNLRLKFDCSIFLSRDMTARAILTTHTYNIDIKIFVLLRTNFSYTVAQYNIIKLNKTTRI